MSENHVVLCYGCRKSLPDDPTCCVQTGFALQHAHVIYELATPSHKDKSKYLILEKCLFV